MDHSTNNDTTRTSIKLPLTTINKATDKIDNNVDQTLTHHTHKIIDKNGKKILRHKNPNVKNI